jgi:hypothetical protein
MVGIFHTHPYDGDGFTSAGYVRPDVLGGGSPSDWDLATSSGFPQYRVTPRYPSRLDPNTKATERDHNPHRWPSNLFGVSAR